VDHAKRDRRRHRLENEKVDEKYVVVEKKSRKSSSGTADNGALQDLQLGIVM